MTRSGGEDTSRARIPADVDQPDQIVGRLTARQLLILAAGAAAVWALYRLVGGWLSWQAFAGVAAPLGAVAGWLAVGARDGLSADRLAAAAVRHRLAPRRLTSTAGRPGPLPRWARPPGRAPGVLTLPARGLDHSGAVDLADGGAALVCEASSVNFGLRSPVEQQRLVAAFGRALNGLGAPVQFVVRSERADLRPAISALREAAGGLPHPALETAALAHAGFLAEVAAGGDVLRRRILVVFRDPSPIVSSAPALACRAEETAAALTAAGIQLQVLDRDAAHVALAAACDPAAPPRPAGLARPGQVITARTPQ